MEKPDLKRFHILVVEDDDMLRECIVFDFQRAGYSVHESSNGKDAFQVVLKQRIDLVVSDMRMPGGDGLSLLEDIRKHDPEIPQLIFVTGFSDVSEAECLLKGAKRVIHKPFERKVLFEAVSDCLGS